MKSARGGLDFQELAWEEKERVRAGTTQRQRVERRHFVGSFVFCFVSLLFFFFLKNGFLF